MLKKLEMLNKFADILNKTKDREDKRLMLQLFMLCKDSEKDYSEPMSFEGLPPEIQLDFLKRKIERWLDKLFFAHTGVYMEGNSIEKEIQKIITDMAKYI